MEQLTGYDARFLYSETPTVHMHTLKVAVCDVSAVAGWTPETATRELGRVLHRIPPLRRRIVDPPLHLDHPFWIEDPDFDLARHVHRRTAAVPGGRRELAAVISAVAGTPLPRDRPLWEVTIVDGLADGRVAFVAKVHHTVADGVATVELLGRAFDATAPSSVAVPEPVPARRALVRAAAAARVGRLRLLPDVLGRTRRGLAAARRGRAEGATRAPHAFAGPRVAWNVSIDATRRFGFTTLPLAPLLAVKDARSVSLNDVFLTVCAGALRRQLVRRGRLPRSPLTASVPISSRVIRDRLGGNHVDNMFVALATDTADPLERLARVHDSARAARLERETIGTELFEERAAFTPPNALHWTIALWGRTHLSNVARPPCNLIASNVPGPRAPLELGGARMTELYSVGPILEGVGLNITAWSYVDALYVSILTCPRTRVDVWELAGDLDAAVAELVGAAAA